MATIQIDGRPVTCRDGIPVLQAALEAGGDIPHYCYHPGLTVVASCRLCLMEMKMPDPRTKELVWSPRLVPSCQTPVRDGMEVRFETDKVRENQRHCMEYYLLNHPLDCPVCDKAGECYLQDYSYGFGHGASRMVEAKTVNPKKDIGSKTLLYQDRCVMCSRCVRFCNEVAGTGELCIVNRGNRAEIDIFPGQPLENPLQGNVVDVCPVGSLLDKEFLMKQRVWMLRSADSVCPHCSTGCTTHVDHNDGRVWRVRPRFNPGVNDWWMCDEGRFGWKHVHDPNRIAKPIVRRGMEIESPSWAEVPAVLQLRFEQAMRGEKAGVAAMLSPFMSCEEAWLLTKYVRGLSPKAVLAMGPVPTVGQDEQFPRGRTNGAPVKFTVRAEKCPNRAGVERVLKNASGEIVSFDDFTKRATAGEFAACWIAGGYPQPWVTKALMAAAAKIGFLVVSDLLANELTAAAAVVLPACATAEREGCFINHAGRIQPFAAAIIPPGGSQYDGQYLYALAKLDGLYRAAKVRERMAREMPEFASVHVPPLLPEHAH